MRPAIFRSPNIPAAPKMRASRVRPAAEAVFVAERLGVELRASRSDGAPPRSNNGNTCLPDPPICGKGMADDLLAVCRRPDSRGRDA